MSITGLVGLPGVQVSVWMWLVQLFFQLANFLSELAQRRHLALSALKGFRSAILLTIKQLGGRVRDRSRSQACFVT